MIHNQKRKVILYVCATNTAISIRKLSFLARWILIWDVFEHVMFHGNFLCYKMCLFVMYYRFDLCISWSLIFPFPLACFSKPQKWCRVKGGKKGRPRKSQTSEDGISTENDSISTEGESGYLDGTIPSSTFDGPVPNSIGNTDCSMDNQGPINESVPSSGVVSDPTDASVEMDNLVPDGSNAGAKIKKPRRSEEYLIILCMLGRDICMLTALLVNWIDRTFPVQLMTLFSTRFPISTSKTFNTFLLFLVVYLAFGFSFCITSLFQMVRILLFVN